MRAGLAVVMAVCATPAVAAPKVKQIKAQFLCGTYVDGAIKEVISGGKRAKVTDPIACAIRIDDPNEPSHMGTINTTRYGKTKTKTEGKTDDFGSQSDAGKKDFEIVLQPGTDFAPCEDFDINAKVWDDLGTYFTKTIKVQQTCPKPKPIAATLTCMYEAQDGTLLKWPGSGDKLKPRLSSGKELTCAVYVKAPPADVTALSTVASIKGKAGTSKRVGLEDVPPSGSKADVSWSPDDGAFDECETFTVETSLLDQDGTTRWSGTRKIVQSCPD